jgi:hypothetical protein
MVASLQRRRYILRRQKQGRKIPHNLRGHFVEVPLQIFVRSGKECRESLRYQCIDREGPPCARAGSPEIYSEMDDAFLVGASGK